MNESTGEATGCGAGAGPGRRSRSTGGAHRPPDRTGFFLEEGPPGTGPDWVFFGGGSRPHRTTPGFFRGGSGREELLLESQEVQELSAGAAASQVVLNMSSEDQSE